MKYGNADTALRAYIDALSEAQRRGFNPKGIEGKVYAARCPKCGGKKWRLQDGAQRCTGFKCGWVRPSQFVFIPKSYFHQRRARSRTGESLHTQRAALSALDSLAELGWVFGRLQRAARWEYRSLLAHVVFRSYPLALERLSRTWPRGPRVDGRGDRTEPGWTLYFVRELVSQARQRVEVDLDDRGLL